MKDERLIKLDALVEANSNEVHYLWLRYSNMAHIFGMVANPVDWKEDMLGFLALIGYMDKRPICISLTYAAINNKNICFWHPTSEVVDYRKISEWFRKNIPSYDDIRQTDAANFANVI